MEMPESMETGTAFLSEPGTYHFSVLNIDEAPTAKNGSLIDGFRIEADVLAGTTTGQEKKQVELMFFNPKLTDKNNGEMAKKKQARFAVAVGLIGGARKAGEKVNVNLQDAKGRQFVATLALDDQQSDGGKKFLRLHFADIWHVDDPAANFCPKAVKALALLPPGLRRSSDSFAKAGEGATTGGAASNGSKQSPPATPPLADLNDL